MTKKVFGKANMNVAGTTFEDRQKKLHALRQAESSYITLRRDTKNENDKNAIAVIAHAISKRGKLFHMCIGYIPKNKAIWMAKAMDEGKCIRVASYKVVGGGKVNLGVELHIVHELYEKEAAPATEQA